MFCESPSVVRDRRKAAAKVEGPREAEDQAAQTDSATPLIDERVHESIIEGLNARLLET